MEEPLKAKQKDQSSQNTLTTMTEPSLWEELQQMPYSRDRIGQGFVTGLTLPKSETSSNKVQTKIPESERQRNDQKE